MAVRVARGSGMWLRRFLVALILLELVLIVDTVTASTVPLDRQYGHAIYMEAVDPTPTNKAAASRERLRFERIDGPNP